MKEDIEKYLKGQLGPEEMHALEMKALSDPFLFDALGGAESIGANDFLAAVRELDQRIGGKQKRKYPQPIVWRIAASVALLIGASYAIYTFIQPKDETLAQQQEEASKSGEESSAPPASSTTTDSLLSLQENSKENLLSLNRAVAPQPSGEVKEEAKPFSEPAKPLTVPSETEAASGVLAEKADDLDKAGPDQLATTESTEKITAGDQGSSGRKKDIDEADASVLSEITVTGYGVGAGEPATGEPIDLAAPADGRRAYNKYLESNLHYPPLAVERKIEGRVALEFAVQADGSLSDFSVVHGLESGCNEEVIRLVREGPRWNPSSKAGTPVKSTVRVSVKFKLPE